MLMVTKIYNTLGKGFHASTESSHTDTGPSWDWVPSSHQPSDTIIQGASTKITKHSAASSVRWGSAPPRGYLFFFFLKTSPRGYLAWKCNCTDFFSFQTWNCLWIWMSFSCMFARLRNNKIKYRSTISLIISTKIKRTGCTGYSE